MSFEARDNEFVFEMSVSSADYIAVGFSDDPVMVSFIALGITVYRDFQ